MVELKENEIIKRGYNTLRHYWIYRLEIKNNRVKSKDLYCTNSCKDIEKCEGIYKKWVNY